MTERQWPTFTDAINEQRRKAREGSGKGTPPPEWQPDLTLAPPGNWPLALAGCAAAAVAGIRSLQHHGS